MKKNLENIAIAINENMPGSNAITVITGRNYPKGVPEWTMMFQEVGRDLAKRLTPTACKVLLYMISLMEYSNHIGCDQKTLSEDLEVSLRSVSGAIAELKEMKVVLSYKDPQDRKRNVYMINPVHAWKGKMHKRQKALKLMDKNQTSLINAFDVQDVQDDNDANRINRKEN